MSPAALAAAFRRKALRLPAEIMAAESLTREQAVKAAKDASSGTLTPSDLHRMGHPYAQRNPTASDPGTINAQSGVLKNSWTGSGPVNSGYIVTTRAFNTDPKSVYMLGTRKMIARPIQDKIIAAVRPARILRLRRALQIALRS